MPKVTGLVEILVNGQLMLNKAGAIARGIGISGEAPVNKPAIMGDTGIHGFAEENVVPECEFTITDRDDVSISDLAQIVEGTVIFRAKKGGKAYVLNDAWFAQPADITAGEGETTILYRGFSWTEMVNAN